MAKKDQGQHCSFCGRPASETVMLLQGLEAQICEHCAEQAYLIIKDELGLKESGGKNAKKGDKESLAPSVNTGHNGDKPQRQPHQQKRRAAKIDIQRPIVHSLLPPAQKG